MFAAIGSGFVEMIGRRMVKPVHSNRLLGVVWSAHLQSLLRGQDSHLRSDQALLATLCTTTFSLLLFFCVTHREPKREKTAFLCRVKLTRVGYCLTQTALLSHKLRLQHCIQRFRTRKFIFATHKCRLKSGFFFVTFI